MNPLKWPRAQQYALAIGTLLGGVGGLIVGYFANQPSYATAFVNPFYSWVFGGNGDYDWGSAEWAVSGAIIGAAVIYTQRLLRNSN